MTQPRCCIVMPARLEGDAIGPVLDRIAESVTLPFECVVVIDDPEDPTIQVVAKKTDADQRFRVVINEAVAGPAGAIKLGIARSSAPVLVVTMADGSDDPRAIDDLVRLVERGVVIAAASRYMAGGQQVGAPFLKSALSRLAGLSLWFFARVGTHDATNSFKAYERGFLERVGIESDHGFEMGLELVAKARRCRLRVAEIPTIWLERSFGDSGFRLWKWLPKYLRWYFVAFTRSRTDPRSD